MGQGGPCPASCHDFLPGLSRAQVSSLRAGHSPDFLPSTCVAGLRWRLILWRRRRRPEAALFCLVLLFFHSLCVGGSVGLGVLAWEAVRPGLQGLWPLARLMSLSYFVSCHTCLALRLLTPAYSACGYSLVLGYMQAASFARLDWCHQTAVLC